MRAETDGRDALKKIGRQAGERVDLERGEERLEVDDGRRLRELRLERLKHDRELGRLALEQRHEELSAREGQVGNVPVVRRPRVAERRDKQPEREHAALPDGVVALVVTVRVEREPDEDRQAGRQEHGRVWRSARRVSRLGAAA